MSIYDIANEFIENTISILNCFLIIMFVFKCKFIINVNKVYILLGYYVAMIFFFVSSKVIPFVIADFLLAVLLLYNLFDERTIKKFTIVILTICIEKIFYVVIQYGLNYFEVDGEFIGQILIFFIILVFLFILNKIFHISFVRGIDKKSSYIYINLLTGIFTLILPLLIISSYENELYRNLVIVILFISVLMIFAKILSTVFYLKKIEENDFYKEEIILKEQLIEAENIYFNTIVLEYQHLRSFRHDIDGHINILYNLAVLGENDKIILYLDEIKQGMKLNIVYKCNDIYVAASIHQFLSLINDNTIEFTFNYEVNAEIKMNNTDICSLFYNLMSNAVEAVLKTKNQRKIILDIQKSEYALYIKMQNTVHSNFDMNELERGNTLKDDNKKHGVGLLNIDKVIKKYNGDIQYELCENTLIISVVLLNVFDQEYNSF